VNGPLSVIGRGWLVAFALVFAALAWPARAEVAIPPVARVTDLTGTLASGDIAALDAKLADLEQRKGSQVAVLVVPTTQPEVIEQYALRVAESWKIGRKGVDDGALLVVAKDDRKLRIEVGYGLEGALNDATAKRIVSDVIVPRFKADDYAGGITAGVDAMVAVIDGEPLPAVSAPSGGEQGLPPASRSAVRRRLHARRRGRRHPAFTDRQAAGGGRRRRGRRHPRLADRRGASSSASSLP
jgi:uncharacterized protein